MQKQWGYILEVPCQPSWKRKLVDFFKFNQRHPLVLKKLWRSDEYWWLQSIYFDMQARAGAAILDM